MVAIKVSRRISGEASKLFSENLDSYIAGEADELSESVSSAGLLRCLKMFARKYIYRSSAAERMEIAGSKIVTGLLDHYGMLLRMSPDDFVYFVEERDLPKKKGKSLDLEWRVFNQLSPRMIKAYKYRIESGGCDELTERARLIVDFIAGMTDDSARDYYQNFMGISI